MLEALEVPGALGFVWVTLPCLPLLRPAPALGGGPLWPWPLGHGEVGAPGLLLLAAVEGASVPLLLAWRPHRCAFSWLLVFLR